MEHPCCAQKGKIRQEANGVVCEGFTRAGADLAFQVYEEEGRDSRQVVDAGQWVAKQRVAGAAFVLWVLLVL
jgi:hypothetical protein